MRVAVAGRPDPLPLFAIARGDHAGERMVQIRRIGLQAQMVDPATPDKIVRVPVSDIEKVLTFHAAFENYTDLASKFNFALYAFNSVFITAVATLLTLLVNSMAAFALSKHRFAGREPVFLVMLATLMIPPTIVLVPELSDRVVARPRPILFGA